MNHTEYILRSIPFFRHFSQNEISLLLKAGRISSFKRSQAIDLKKSGTFNIILKGIFEVEAFGRKDVAYISPGSFFGTMPFTDHVQQGRIKAAVDSELLIFDEEELVKIFIVSWKGMRGYIRSLGKLGFDISPAGKKYFSGKSRVAAVYGDASRCGKSLLASLLGGALSRSGKTIILDLAHTGSSLFDFFEKKISPPLSQKQADGPGMEELINGRIAVVNPSLHLLNVSFGSRVKVNPAILSPVLFILSREYRYVILDLSDHDPELRDSALGVTDTLFAISGSAKKTWAMQEMLGEKLMDAQRIYYVANEFITGPVKSLEGGLLMERLDYTPGKDGQARLMELSGTDMVGRLTAPITEKKRALVCESNLLESVSYAGFLNASEKMGITYNILYSSSFGYIIMALYLTSRDPGDFSRRVADFFSDVRFPGFLDISFPEEHVFKRGNIVKYSQELFMENRLENYRSLPVARLSESRGGGWRLFSSGRMCDVFSASFLMHPEFQSVKIHGREYASGYPWSTVQAEDLFRTDVDEIYSVSVTSREPMVFKSDRVLQFYRNYLENLARGRLKGGQSDLSDKNIVIDVTEKKLKVEKFIEVSEKSSFKSLKTG